MKFAKSSETRHLVDFMLETEKLILESTVKEFIEHLENDSTCTFTECDKKYLDKKFVEVKCYELKIGKLVKDFLVTETGRLFYSKSLIWDIELID